MIELIFEVGINLLETFIIFEFLTRYLGSKYSDKRKLVGFLLGWFTGFVELCIMNFFVELESFGAYIPIIINFVYSLLFLNGSILLKLLMSAMIHIIVLIIAYTVNLGICNVIGYNSSDMIMVFNSIRVIGVVITKIILFYVTRIILKYRYKNPIDSRLMFMLIIIPMTSIISLAALMKAAINHSEIQAYIFVGMICIIIANVMTYYFFTIINKEYETKLKIQLLEQQNENAKKNIENADAFIKQMKAVRHDIKNQLIAIGGYLDKEKFDDAKKYINGLTENYLPNIQEYINTGNDAFDAIVNSKIALCNQKNIFMLVSVMEKSLTDMNAVDIGVLFGNLLDNAIEAADKTKSRRITIEVQIEGEYLSIIVKNSIEKSVLENNSNLETSKKNKTSHGIGIRSVKSIVKKYDGMLQFYEEQNEFCCHILLDLNMME